MYIVFLCHTFHILFCVSQCSDSLMGCDSNVFLSQTITTSILLLIGIDDCLPLATTQNHCGYASPSHLSRFLCHFPLIFIFALYNAPKLAFMFCEPLVAAEMVVIPGKPEPSPFTPFNVPYAVCAAKMKSGRATFLAA